MADGGGGSVASSVVCLDVKMHQSPTCYSVLLLWWGHVFPRRRQSGLATNGAGVALTTSPPPSTFRLLADSCLTGSDLPCKGNVLDTTTHMNYRIIAAVPSNNARANGVPDDYNQMYPGLRWARVGPIRSRLPSAGGSIERPEVVQAQPYTL